ncbi:stage II sporulation protein P [Anaerofustis stercorihominis]|uniref:stage II sporulation protein P n=1 Tax=Anaerofustis stercorihominis TaxID=214853 RepID=UPI0011075B03|nr:stage II sporulation protein P [Anaerofustis stercorihominis]
MNDDSNSNKKTGSIYGFTKNIFSLTIPCLALNDVGYEEVEVGKDKEEALNSSELKIANKKMNDDKTVSKVNDGKPLVLIYHTHATESFKDKTSKGTYRSRENDENMVSVGEEMAEVLEKEYGIICIHDTSLHDYPSYNAAYDNSLESAEKILKENPSIKYVFDIHRDGLPSSNNNEKYNGKVGSKSAAKVMTVLGMNHKNSSKNLSFANKINKQFSSMYPDINLGIIKREPYRYNQWLSPNSLLFEIGSNLNNLEEAKYSAKLLGRVVGEVIKEDMK